MKKDRFMGMLTAVCLCLVPGILFACADAAPDGSTPQVPVTYTLTFMVGDTVYNTFETEGDVAVTMPGDPEVGEDKEFGGWYLDEGVWEEPFVADTLVTSPITEDTVVYAKVTDKIVVKEKYTLTFMVGDRVYDTLETEGDVAVTLPTDPEVGEDKEFGGWYLDEGVWEEPFVADTLVTSPITEDTVVYAKVTDKIVVKEKYTLTFMVGDTVYDTLETEGDVAVTLPGDPEVGEDKEFGGWYLDNGVWEEPFAADTLVTSPITEDTVVYAKVTEKIFYVEFICDDEVFETKTVKWEQTAAAPADPELGVGYVFEGWFTDKDAWNVPYTGEELITEDTKVYAKLKKFVLDPANADIGTIDVGAKVWSGKDYTFKSLPKAFIGKPYILWSIDGPNSARAIRSGWVYVITGEVKGFGNDAQSQAEKLDGYNFTQKDVAFWDPWTAALKNNLIYEKHVEKGDSFEFGRWTVIVMSDEQLDLTAGEPIPGDGELAALEPAAGDEVCNMQYGAKVFGDRAYTFYDMPYYLAGKNYIQSGYASKTHSAKVVKDGTVFMLTSKGGSISLVASLTAGGWEDVTATIASDLNLFGDKTQNGAFLNSPYNGFALLKKRFTVGETLSWAQWGIPVFSGEFVPGDGLAELEAVGSSKPCRVEEGMRLFSDRTYYAVDGIPLGLEGLTYFLDGIEAGATVRAVTAGSAYIAIPADNKVYAALQSEVEAAGWKRLPHRHFRLAVGQLFANRLYTKQVTAGEEIHFGKYNLVFGAPLSDPNGYYVMPSLTAAAELIYDPEGDRYDTDKQNWLGCPTVEKTAKGRVWSGWFTGGARELGTGNYAIIGYSDDDCASFKKSLAVVHPDTAVQVTKPELWTAPDGKLWLFWIQHTGAGNFDGKMGTWASVCADPDAASPVWSQPRRLTDGYMRSKPIVVDDKGVTTFMYAAFDWMQPHYTCVYASTDGGNGWSLRGKAECLDTSSGKNNLDDPVLARHPDGRLWLLLRPSSGNRVYESFSSDGGRSWTHARPSNIVGPQSRLTVDILPDGKILLVFHDDDTNRTRLAAFLSTDGGKTWGYKLLLDERGDVSYPDTVVTADGTIYVIYDRNRTSDMEVYMAVFTLDDITAGAFVSPGSRQKILIDKPKK